MAWSEAARAAAKEVRRMRAAHNKALSDWTLRGIPRNALLVGNCVQYGLALRKAVGGGKLIEFSHPEIHNALRFKGKYYDAGTVGRGVKNYRDLAFFKHIGK